MANETQAYKRSLSGSVGAGMGSLFNGGGKTYFILEHKVSSKYHKAGEAQEIIVDQVELGRDSSCAVRFDETFKTVSRRHAAIVRDGANWKLVQLSSTNTTFLNGHPVQKEWYLQNGDEIQLSVNGPKLGFLIPTGKKSTVGSIGLSRRLSLFRQQALRPYKTAMYVMSAVIVLLICAGVGYGYWDYQNDLKREVLSKQQLAEAQRHFDEQISESKAQNEQLVKSLDTMRTNNIDLAEKLKTLERKGSGSGGSRPIVTPSNSGKLISKLEHDIYFVTMDRIEVTYNGVTEVYEEVGTGSGFLLNDGRFITARHVVEPWYYPSDVSDEFSLSINAAVTGGGTAVCYLTAYSPNGTSFTLVSTNAKTNKSSDEYYDTSFGKIAIPSEDASDYAIFHTNKTGVLKCDNELSRSMPVGTKLMSLGYPHGLGANSVSDIHPLYSEATVAKEGLNRGMIVTTATTFEHGNSGGPVFAITNNGNVIVVGIVSGGQGNSTGFVVPISAIK